MTDPRSRPPVRIQGWLPTEGRGVRVRTLNSTYWVIDHQFFQRFPNSEAPRPQPESIGGRLRDLRIVPYRAVRWNGDVLQIVPGIGPRELAPGILGRGILTSPVVSCDGGWMPDSSGDANQPHVCWQSCGFDSDDEVWAKLDERPQDRGPAVLEVYRRNVLLEATPLPRDLAGTGQSLLAAALEWLRLPS